MNEGGRGRLLLLFEKAEKLLGALSQEDFGSGGGTGELRLTPAPHMSFTHSFKQYSPLQIVSVESKTMKWQLSPPPCLSTGTPGSHTPRAHTFLLPPPDPLSSPVFVMLFFFPITNHIFWSLVSLRSLQDFSLS